MPCLFFFWRGGGWKCYFTSELGFLLSNPLPCPCLYWQWTKYAFIQCAREVTVHLCMEGAALWIPMHRTHNVVCVSSVTFPLGLLPALIVTVSTVHSLRLQLECFPLPTDVQGHLAHYVLLTYNWRYLPPHSPYVSVACWLTPIVICLNFTVYLLRFQRGRSMKLFLFSL